MTPTARAAVVNEAMIRNVLARMATSDRMDAAYSICRAGLFRPRAPGPKGPGLHERKYIKLGSLTPVCIRRNAHAEHRTPPAKQHVASQISWKSRRGRRCGCCRPFVPGFACAGK